MLTEQQIQQALHASRVVPLGVASSHGPVGLEHLAEAVARLVGSPAVPSRQAQVQRPIALPEETWEKLDHLARAATQTSSRPVSPSEVAAAIIQHFVTAT
jgi:hypothetical protein